MQQITRKRIWFWMFLLTAAVAVYVFGILPQQRVMARSKESVALLRPLITADPRYAAVRVEKTTSGAIFIFGDVQTDSDLDTLKRLVDDAHPPRKPVFAVSVSPNPQ